MCCVIFVCVLIQVSALRALVAEETSLPLERLKLIYKGKTLLDLNKDEPVSVKLIHGGIVF